MLELLGKKIVDYLPNILTSLLIFAIGYLAIKMVLKVMRKAFSRSKLDETGCSFIISVTKAVLYVMLFVMVLSQLKVPMSSIFAALGTAGLAIVVALKDSLTNVAGGIIVMFSRPFRVGDYIEISGKEGNVSRITLIYTTLLTLDNKAVIIPNSTVVSATVTNYTKEDMRRLELRFAVSYDSDFSKAKLLVYGVCQQNPLALDKPAEPYVRMSSHDDSSVELLLRVWVKTEDYWELRYGLLEEVKTAFEANGITIPFPQLDIHEDTH